MNICEEYAVLIQEYLDDQLSGADRARVMEHLGQCDACRAYFQQLTEMQDAFAAMEAEVPAGLSASIMQQVKATAQIPAKKKFRWQRYSMLAACLALVCIAGFYGLGGGMSMKDAAAESTGADFAYDMMADSKSSSYDAGAGNDDMVGFAPEDAGDSDGSASIEGENTAPQEPMITVNGKSYPANSTHVLMVLEEKLTEDQETFFASCSIASGDIPTKVENPENYKLYLLPSISYEKAADVVGEIPCFVTVSEVTDAADAGLLVMVPLNS